MRSLAKVVCLVFLGSSLSFTQQLTATQSWEIPFRLYGGFAVVLRGSIGDLEDCNLVIDTGTSPTLVDERIVRKLRLSSSTSRMSVVSGEVASEEALLPRLEIGPVVKKNFTVAVKNLDAMSDSIGVRIDALVGLDVLGNVNLRINYEHHMIAFSDTLPNAPNKAAFQDGSPFVVLAMKLNKQLVRVLVDTGSFGLVLFEGRAGALRRLPGSPSPSKSVGGDTDMQEIQVQDTSVGGMPVGVRHAFLAKGPKKSAFDGLLGVTGLGAREISFDFEHGQFAWR